MILGFTGTRRGMTESQQETFCRLLCELPGLTEFHHGDCLGADDEAVDFVRELNIEDHEHSIAIHCHPPKDETHRAFNPHHDVLHEPLTHFARNRAIVAACDLLIACPCEMEHQSRGGTWMTHDHAIKKGKRVIVVWPDGTMKEVKP